MNVKAVLSTLVILCFVIFAAATAASRPGSRPWLAVMTYQCRRSNNTCIGVVLDNHWVLTTASCFSKCSKLEPPLQLSVYVNIPPGVQGRLASSVRMGSKVDGSLVWQHPDFNSSTFANNLALVQLGCHYRTLEKLSLATNCSSHGDRQIKFNGYVFANGLDIKVENTKTDKTNCFAKKGTGTWYHLDNTLQMLTTTSRPSCVKTSICNNSERLISVMQGNKLNCTKTLSFTIFPKKFPTEASVEISASTQVSTSTEPLSTEAPTSHSVNTGRIPTQVPMKTQISSSTSSSVQVATFTKVQTMTESVTPSVMPTPTSIKISKSTPVSSSSLTSSLVVVNTSTITTPTKSPTSGCQLSIENGVATPLNKTEFLIITYTCDVGYRFKTGTRPITLVCTNGEMVAKPPPCESITCPPVEPIANGQVVVSGSGLGDSATYSCNEGYVLFDGYTVRRCTEDLEWSGNSGVCKRACPIPDALVCNDGQKIFPSAFKYGMIGDSASYRPKQGYTVIGELPVCQSDSTWTTPPKCLKLCNEKEVIANAEIVIHRNASSYTRTIICDDGYEADGFAEQHCTSYGQWTPHFQECKKTCSPIAIDKGIAKMRKSPGLPIFAIKCDKGFHLEPSAEEFYVACINGQWSPSLPRCVEDK